MDRKEIIDILSCEDPASLSEVFEDAYRVKLDNVGGKVYLRGIIEFSNICRRDCCYCGIRKSMVGLDRYSMSKKEILQCAKLAHEMRYGSVVLQSGERSGRDFTVFIEDIIKEIKKETRGELGITLSLGEQDERTLRTWREAGAHRYLLRIETSNEKLFKKLHPNTQAYSSRVECLSTLKHAGYQVGTGVMIGLPYQTLEDLADDVLFFKKMDVDMIGMGPYIPHEGAPLSGVPVKSPEDRFALGLKLIAVTRLMLRDVNIASTTALQSLHPEGREKGLKCGANVVMPNLTPREYRSYYRLYEGKVCLEENAEECALCLDRRVRSIGETIGYRDWGDSPHFFKRTGEKQSFKGG